MTDLWCAWCLVAQQGNAYAATETTAVAMVNGNTACADHVRQHIGDQHDAVMHEARPGDTARRISQGY